MEHTTTAEHTTRPIVAARGRGRGRTFHAVDAADAERLFGGTACGRVIYVVMTGPAADVTCERCLRHYR